jgi:hypothetical protein
MYILELRRGLVRTVAYARSRRDLFHAAADTPTLPSGEEKDSLWALWQRMLDLTLSLDRAADAHSRWAWARNRSDRDLALLSFAAAYLAPYRCALDYVALAECRPVLDAVLNDAVPEMGLPPRTYDAYKRRFLDAARGAEFAMLRAAMRALSPACAPALSAAASEDSAALWAKGLGEGPVLTAKNATAVIRKATIDAWFPVQRRASLTLSHLRLPVRPDWHITPS